MFAAITRFFAQRREKRRLIRRFSDYVDPDLVEYCLSHRDPQTFEPRSQSIEFIVALMSDEDLDSVPPILSEVLAAMDGTDYVLEQILGPLVFVTFGTFPRAASRPPADQRKEAVSRLQKRLGDHITIVHGSGNGLVGDFGDRQGRAVRYGSIVEGFSNIVRLLGSLKPGEVREWIPASA